MQLCNSVGDAFMMTINALYKQEIKKAPEGACLSYFKLAENSSIRSSGTMAFLPKVSSTWIS